MLNFGILKNQVDNQKLLLLAAFLTGFRREIVQRAVDTRRAIEGSAGIPEQYVEEPD